MILPPISHDISLTNSFINSLTDPQYLITYFIFYFLENKFGCCFFIDIENWMLLGAFSPFSFLIFWSNFFTYFRKLIPKLENFSKDFPRFNYFLYFLGKILYFLGYFYNQALYLIFQNDYFLMMLLYFLFFPILTLWPHFRLFGYWFFMLFFNVGFLLESRGESLMTRFPNTHLGLVYETLSNLANPKELPRTNLRITFSVSAMIVGMALTSDFQNNAEIARIDTCLSQAKMGSHILPEADKIFSKALEEVQAIANFRKTLYFPERFFLDCFNKPNSVLSVHRIGYEAFTNALKVNHDFLDFAKKL